MTSVVPILVAVLNSLWQAVIVAALVWLALKLARRLNLAINAATRYVIWWVVLGVVALLPAAPRLRWSRLQPATGAPAPARAVAQPASPAVEAAPVLITLHEQRSAPWPIWVLGIWSALFLYRLAEITRSYFYLRCVKRRASISSLPLLENKRSASLLLSHEVASPMAVGFLRPAVILPASLESEITGQQLHYVLLHEYAHLARRDDWWNLMAHLMGAALALHPAAWWILRQIEREREMACDDWVVARTGAARPYAVSLARLSELRLSRRKQLQGEALAAGILGGASLLGERIEALLHGAASRGSSRLVGGFFFSVLVAFTVAASSAPRWIAFAQEARLSFDVASVKSNKDAATPSFVRVSPAGIDYSRAPLTRIIAEAYQIPYARITTSDSRIRELLSETYDIQGKADHAASGEQLMLMLQALLQDRFKLSLHHESRIQPVYKLAARQDGPKLHESASDNGLAASALTPDGVTFRNMTMWRFAAFLTGRLDRPVVDATGLTGIYDFNLQLQSLRDLTQLDPAAAKAVMSDWSSSSIFSDIQKLGLSLDASKAPVDNLRIDRLEKPDAN